MDAELVQRVLPTLDRGTPGGLDLLEIIHNAPDIIARYDLQLRHVYVNGAVERATGMPAASFLGKTNEELGMPEELARFWREELGRVLESGQATEVSYQLPGPDGVRFYQARVAPEISGGCVRSVLAISRDITEAKLAEESARRLIAEQASRAAAEVGERRYRFLAEATVLLDASLDDRKTLSCLARLAVPSLADYCVVHLVDPQGRPIGLATAHVDPEQDALLAEVERRAAPSLDGRSSPCMVLRDGEPILLAQVEPGDLDAIYAEADSRRVQEKLRPCSLMLVPLLGRGRVLGTMAFAATGSRRRYGTADVTMVQDLARRAALALDNARLYEAEQAARRRAERAASRTARLQQVAAALSGALTAAEVVSALVEEVRCAVDAQGVSLYQMVDDGETVQRVGSSGQADELGATARCVPVTAPLPLADAARTGTLLCFETSEVLLERYPVMADLVTSQCGALACIPLFIEDRSVGVVVATFCQRRSFETEDGPFLLTLGRQCAEALERARLYEAERLARWSSERAAERTARLQSFTAALSEAMTLAQVADVVVGHGARAVEALTGGLWGLEPGGTVATLQRSSGVDVDAVATLGRAHFGKSSPVAEVIMHGRPMWLGSARPHGPSGPHPVGWGAAPWHPGADHEGALAILPLPFEGRSVGAVTFLFGAAREFDEDERSFIALLTRQAAQALDRARLYEAEQRARADAESAQDRLALLAEGSRILAEAALDFEAVMKSVTRFVTQSLGDSCLVALLSEDGEWVRPMADHHREVPDRGVLSLRQFMPGPCRASEGLPGRVIETGYSVLVSDVEGPGGNPDSGLGPWLERIGLRSLLVVPLRTHGRVIGVVASGRERSRRAFTEADKLLLQELADRAGLAIENARHHRQAQHAVGRMKDALEERENALAALSSERQRLEAVLQQMPAGVAIVEAPSGRLVLGNEQVERILKVPLEPATQAEEVHYLGFHADGRPYEPQDWPIERSLSTGEIITGEEIDIVRGDGTRGAVRVSSAPIRDALGKIVAGVVTFDEITQEKRAKEVLRASEGKLRRLVDSNIIGVVFGDGGDGITESNDAFLRLVGLEPQDPTLRHLRWSELTPAEYAELDRRAREECRRTGSCTPYEKEFLRSDGVRVPVLFGAAFLDESCRDWVGFVLDLTERKRAERHIEELNRDLERRVDEFQTLIDVIPIGIGIARDPECRSVTYNPHFSRLMGLEPGREASGLPAAVTASGRPLELAELPMQQAAMTGRERLDLEMDVVLEDGRPITLLGYAAPLFDEVLRPRGAIGAFLDITERKRSEDAFRMHAMRVKALAEASRVFAETGLDFQTALQSVARYLAGLIGDACAVRLLTDDGTALTIAAVHHTDPDENARLQDLGDAPAEPLDDRVFRILQAGEPVVLLQPIPGFDPRNRTPEPGSFSYLERFGMASALLAPLRLQGRSIGYLGLYRTAGARPYGTEEQTLVRDLADRAAMAIESARLYREAQTAILLRDEFLSIASHELKTPVTSLQLYLEGSLRRLRAGMSEAEVGEVLAPKLEAANRQVHRLGRLIEELLDVSRISAGRLTLELVELDLCAVVRDVVQRFEQEAARSGCAVMVELPAAVPGRWDRIRLEQLVSNLLSNALKYGRGMPVRIKVTATDEHACLSVRDGGIGIAAGDQVRIFGRFERLVSSKHFGGFGLGLWICRQIVDALGGRFELTSEVGRGSTFEVHLPRASGST